MEEHYDVIVLGSGLKECILSCLMSFEGKKVLHIDRNNYYGGSSTSHNLDELFEHFKVGSSREELGKSRDWNVDLIPKFLMADGKLVKLLVYMGITNYIDFVSVQGSFVQKDKKVEQMPCETRQVLTSKLIGLFDKKKLRKFLSWVNDVELDNPGYTDPVYTSPMDMYKDNMQHAFKHFGIGDEIQNLVGHAICLYGTDDFKTVIPAYKVIKKIKLYKNSVERFSNSPFVYPLYGLGELSQGFARCSAVHGGTFMLNKHVDEIVLGDGGKCIGVKCGSETVTCDNVICDPSYATDRVKKSGKIVRAICLLNHPLDCIGRYESAQIIIPQHKYDRKNVCAEGYHIALVATEVETSTPEAELKPGLDLLGSIAHKFISIEDSFKPVDDGRQNRIFISSSFDPETHFESTITDVLKLYERITGNKFDFSKVKGGINQEGNE